MNIYDTYNSFWNQSRLFHGVNPLELISFSNPATRTLSLVSSPIMMWTSRRGERGVGKEGAGGGGGRREKRER